jgi:hypothetical protein
MRSRTINIPIYCGSITFYESEDLNVVAKKIGIEKSLDGYTAFFWHKSRKNGYVEYILAFEPNPKESVVAHECVHFSNRLFMDHGIELDPDNDEPYAYFMGWAVNECHKFLKTKPK